MRIGILGGSFDPVHQGHLTLARESERQFQLDKILFIPAAQPPHKRADSVLTPAPIRARMVALAIQEEPKWELCDLELARPGVSYTVDTLRSLRKDYPPSTRFFFIAGSDSFQDLPRWKEPEEILRLCEWIVAPRLGFPLPEKMPPGFHRLEIKPIAVSASEIREKCRQGADVSDWIPEKVQDYLVRLKVYGEKTS